MSFESENYAFPLKGRTDDPMVPIRAKKSILMPDPISHLTRPCQDSHDLLD